MPPFLLLRNLRPRESHALAGAWVVAELMHSYGRQQIGHFEPVAFWIDPNSRMAKPRDQEKEQKSVERLRQLGAKEHTLKTGVKTRSRAFLVPASDMARLAGLLLAEGWQVQADAKQAIPSAPGAFHMGVSSGLDWFDLTGSADFDGQSVGLPELLDALKRNNGMVDLGNGRMGVIPGEIARQLRPLLDAAKNHGEGLRFGKNQAALLDALAVRIPGISCDDAFARIRESLRDFRKIEPVDPPASFLASLRPYQREGLGWLHFLQHLGTGGVLADDMGLGKTIQVLALLEGRAAVRRSMDADAVPVAPSLVVAPRTLLTNWRMEAAKFAPQLRVMIHDGPDRAKTADDFAQRVAAHDLVLTTYGLMRLDAPALHSFDFDYAILDEAQAVKNADAATAKAARLLRARHRLAMSGTPVENHLGELASLFDFLAPGLLGRWTAALGAGGKTGKGNGKSRDQGTGKSDAPDPASDAMVSLMAATLRPFILRRTKAQVLAELPPKVEQTLMCEMPPRQKKSYDELLAHYRRALLGKKAPAEGGEKNMLVIEALLRLRQAACHPGLIAPERAGEESAKLDILVDRLKELAQEGHKALVFSQFTSFLDLLEPRLRDAGLAHARLDGQTADRQAQVERFQTDAACPVFLLSLKAGGVGLNLTAASYVFLLDPWWNPAIEAQAADRAHRMGQTRTVFITRLIAQGTLEERVLELQDRKRTLADAVLKADAEAITRLTRDELEKLLG